MLAEERHALILDLVNQQGNVKLTELCSRLHASQSTIRRDLLELSEQGLLTKVHGGAISRNERFFPVEHNMEEKANLYIAEKTAIARYAASLHPTEKNHVCDQRLPARQAAGTAWLSGLHPSRSRQSCHRGNRRSRMCAEPAKL